MKKQNGTTKLYTLRYAPHIHNSVVDVRIVAEVRFGFFSYDAISKVRMVWHNMGSESAPHIMPRLECWYNEWDALAQLKDIIDELATVNNQALSPEEFCQMLERHGFQGK